MYKLPCILLILLSWQSALLLSQPRGLKPLRVKINEEQTLLYAESHALLIGNSDYTAGWEDLPGVKRDMVAVKNALEENGFHVVVKENLDRQGLDKAFGDFIANYGGRPENRLLFYFAGHGHTLQTSYGEMVGYIVPADASNPNRDLSGFKSKALPMRRMEEYARNIESKHALFLFDACFSGSLFNMRSQAVSKFIQYQTTMPVRQFITSGSENEQVPDESIFRKMFVEAITTSQADLNGDGYLTGSELGIFLQEQVINYSGEMQHPQYGKIRNPNLDKGDFVFELSKSERKPDKAHGSIALETQMVGALFVNGKMLRTLEGLGTSVQISQLPPSQYTLEIVGPENWKKRVWVEAGKSVSVIAK